MLSRLRRARRAHHAPYSRIVRDEAIHARERRLALLRLGLLAATLAAIVVYFAATGFRPSAEDVRDWGESLGPAGPILFIPLSIGLACLLFPGPLLAGAAGLLFGTALGIPIAIASATRHGGRADVDHPLRRRAAGGVARARARARGSTSCSSGAAHWP